jgi:hypothetical protein
MKLEQTLSDKLQSAEEDRTVNIAHTEMAIGIQKLELRT